jgi:hypothetical protein
MQPQPEPSRVGVEVTTQTAPQYSCIAHSGCGKCPKCHRYSFCQACNNCHLCDPSRAPHGPPYYSVVPPGEPPGGSPPTGGTGPKPPERSGRSLPPLPLAMYNVLRTLGPGPRATIRSKELNARLPQPFTGGNYNGVEFQEAIRELTRACHAQRLPDIGCLIVSEMEERRSSYPGLTSSLPIYNSPQFQAFEAMQRQEREMAMMTQYPEWLPAAPYMPPRDLSSGSSSGGCLGVVAVVGLAGAGSLMAIGRLLLG